MMRRKVDGTLDHEDGPEMESLNRQIGQSLLLWPISSSSSSSTE